MRILLVEDNRRLSDSLRLSLVDEGYAVDVAYDGQEGEELAELTPYALIILDVMLPRRSGIEVCRSLRNHHIKTPILMLTARDALEDRVVGLDSGADDYLVKPFEMDELQARLRALLRRESDDKSGLIKIADLTLDPATHFVQRGGQSIELTSREYALLEYLIRNPNRLITRQMAENHLWSQDATVMSNVVDVYIRRLRRKIDDPFEVKLIETIRGSGYRLAPARVRFDMKFFNRLNLILHSIRFRLALWFVFILAVLITGFSSMLFYMQIKELQAETLIRLESKLENIEKAFGTDPANLQTAEAGGFPLNSNDDDTSFQNEDVLAFYTSDGSLEKMWGPFTEIIILDQSQINKGDEREPLID